MKQENLYQGHRLNKLESKHPQDQDHETDISRPRLGSNTTALAKPDSPTAMLLVLLAQVSLNDYKTGGVQDAGPCFTSCTALISCVYSTAKKTFNRQA